MKITLTSNWMKLENIIQKVCIDMAEKFYIVVTYRATVKLNNSVNVKFIHRNASIYAIDFTEDFINSGKFENVYNDLRSDIGMALTKLNKIDVNQEIGGYGLVEGVRPFDD